MSIFIGKENKQLFGYSQWGQTFKEMCQKNYQKIKAVGTVTKLSEYKNNCSKLETRIINTTNTKAGNEGRTNLTTIERDQEPEIVVLKTC